MKMPIDWLKTQSRVDGPGRRTVVHVQGCPIRCHGCQNARLWDFDGGIDVGVERVAEVVMTWGDPLTITGGEPLAQAAELAALVRCLRDRGYDEHIVLYTGFVCEDIVDVLWWEPGVAELVTLVDVVVDGPYIAHLDDDALQWRGSRNQRPISVVHSMAVGYPVIEVGWDEPTIIVEPNGDVVGAAAVMEGLGGGEPARRCGQHEEG